MMIGCRPTVREVAEFLKAIPIGISQDEVWVIVEEAYGKDMRKYRRGFYGVPSFSRLDENWINVNKGSIERVKSEEKYYEIHPVGLLKELPADGFFETVWFVKESKYGDGRVNLFYDSNTNYMGFFAYSFLEKQKKGEKGAPIRGSGQTHNTLP